MGERKRQRGPAAVRQLARLELDVYTRAGARLAGTPQLTVMAAVAPGTVWAVGSVWDGTNGAGNPLVMRATNG